MREIIRVPGTPANLETLVTKLDALNAAQVIATQRDIEQWKRIEYGTEKSKGGIKGTDYDSERNRTHIRDKVRQRLDYPALPSPLALGEMGAFSMGITTFGLGGVGGDEFSQGGSGGGSTEW